MVGGGWFILGGGEWWWVVVGCDTVYNKSLILASTICVTVFVYTSTFASLVGVPVGIASSAGTIKICVITAGMKIYKPIIKKKKEKHDRISRKSLS